MVCNLLFYDFYAKSILYIIYNFNYNRLKYSTGEFINPINWDSSNQRAKLEKKLNKPLKENLKSVNLQLNRYEESIGSILTDFKKQNQQPTIDTIRMEKIQKVTGTFYRKF